MTPPGIGKQWYDPDSVNTADHYPIKRASDTIYGRDFSFEILFFILKKAQRSSSPFMSTVYFFPQVYVVANADAFIPSNLSDGILSLLPLVG